MVIELKDSMSTSSSYLLVKQSRPLRGVARVTGAKNAVLVIMASLLLTEGISFLRNVPISDDIYQMINLLRILGVRIRFDDQQGILEIDTSHMIGYTVPVEIMKKMRASILVMGPLLVRQGRAHIAMPGGCLLGDRPIDFHLKSFALMGVDISVNGEFVNAHAPSKLQAKRFILEYPSVGATENIMMAAVLIHGKTEIVNAALEPEVLDLITVLRKMGACIEVYNVGLIVIEGVASLKAVEHTVIADRLEAGSLLLAAAATGGSIEIPEAPSYILDVFLEKLREMGHLVTCGPQGRGVIFKSCESPRAVSFKTMPYPGFPTDLQAPMMAVMCKASGVSVIQETVFENRLLHVRELQKMGAQVTVEGTVATVKGVDELYGADVIAPDIRAAAGLLIAALSAQGETMITGVHHLRRGYQNFEGKLRDLGAEIYGPDVTTLVS
jgi:UDP-N-acetylglucosamine 1-carboxyvinyltransferase